MGNDFTFGILGVLIGGVLTGLFNWLVQRGKNETDESVAVLAEWSKLNGALSARLATVEKEFADYRQQVSKQFEELQKRHSEELQEMRRTHEAEMSELRRLNRGLQRQIAQNSQSTAQLLSASPVTQPKDECDED